MKLSFHGAARTVTGSKHLIHLENGSKILMDCGMFQGLGKETIELNKTWGFSPASVDCVVLSHAHIDHIGLLPKLVKDGFKGPVYCTGATADLAQILLQDSARIQESDVRHINKKRARDGKEPYDPLYTEEDAALVQSRLKTLEYSEVEEILNGVKLMFTDCGHLLGSGAVNLEIMEHGKTTRITFSGDIGRYNDLILRKPQPFPQADYVIIESTYGDTIHELAVNASKELLQEIQHTCMEKKGKLIIPAFSVGRTQELLYILNRLDLERRLPALNYYVDSPLSISATQVISKHPECFNAATKILMERDDDVFNFTGLKFTASAAESKALNADETPCVIIASSGMADAGRIKHHIVHGISQAKNTIFMVGYASPQSLAGKLKNGAKEVSIFGDEYEVNAEIKSIGSMSAHGDADDLCHWLGCQDAEQLKGVFLVHGEYDVQVIFQNKLERKGYKKVSIPAMHQEVDI